jgi:hypothetical protein
MATSDSINHPPHYTFGAIEVIDAIEAWQLGFHLGNVVKYVARAAHKGRSLDDLKKARWYLDREIGRREEHHVNEEANVSQVQQNV